MTSRRVYGTSLAMAVVSLLVLEGLQFMIVPCEDDTFDVEVPRENLPRLDSIIKRIGDA